MTETALRTIGILVAAAGLFASASSAQVPEARAHRLKVASTLPAVNLLTRRYEEGEKIVYTMKASNQADRYVIRAEGLVKRDSSGKWFEEFAWSNLVMNEKSIPLPPPSADFRQRLSLAPGYPLSVPDLSGVPRLVGPITDLLTFYADWQVASQQPGLAKPGDHVVVPLNFAPSWADGNRIVLGEDSFDFDVTLKDIDQKDQIATIVVRHVPPAKPLLKIPVGWMRAPVADTPNNWVEVQKNSDGTFAAQVGKETFDVEMKVDLNSGRIISGSIVNLVKVLERKCSDAALTKAGDPVRYQIERKIEIH